MKKGHKKMGSHPHDKHAAMPQFNEGHWEKDMEDVEMKDDRYASEMNTAEEYKSQVDKLTGYVKKHRMQY